MKIYVIYEVHVGGGGEDYAAGEAKVLYAGTDEDTASEKFDEAEKSRGEYWEIWSEVWEDGQEITLQEIEKLRKK
ncbi:hypothetical protein WMW72_10690 [Paenibacillus filicis]|uniref:Uncharacterized protein n=1 Tax=Paenibacillus filicis TaxID=669464 RepID=A0ABU9DJW8_9BACL